MDYFEALLFVLLSTGRILRTKIQKIIYFASQLGITEDTFLPHYYGPYSREVAETLESLVSLGFAREEIEIFSEGIGYLYSLTEDGKLLVTELSKKILPEHIDKLNKIIVACKDASPLLLSLAAKVHFVLKENKVPMTIDQVCEYAKGLNWQISNDQITAACMLLERLGFIKKQTG
jgi:uncharacterized protein YwgA